MFEVTTGFQNHWNFPDSGDSTYKDLSVVTDPVPDLDNATKQLQALFPTRPDIGFLRTDAQFLQCFLRARKFRLSEAFALLCRYYEYRQRQREICVGLSAEAPGVRAALEEGTVGVLPEKDPKGRHILVIFANNWDPSKYELRVIFQTVLLSLEVLMENVNVQLCGIVAVIDWSDFPARQTTRLSPRLLRTMLDGLQDSFPMRLGALHLVNQPWYVEAALSLARPFLKEKLRARIYFHGNNLHKLHEHLPARLLPAELGGEKGEYNSQAWLSTMLKSRQATGVPTEVVTPRSPRLRESTSCGLSPSEEDEDSSSHSDILLAK